MKPFVFIARPIPKEVEAYIAEHCEYRKWDREEPISKDVLFDELKEAQGLLTFGGVVNEELLEQAPKLKVVSNISVGYNNFDLDAMRRHQVIGTNTPYVLDDTVADLVFALILSAARRVPELDRLVRNGEWTKGADDRFFGRDVHHSKIGIIGMGRIGEAIAKRAIFGFDMDVVYYNRKRKPDIEEKLGLKYAPLNELLSDCDFIVLMTPLTPETEKMIGKEQFEQMKRTAFFINASRGQTVDESALIEALRSGTIAGAGLDVFEKEPVQPDNPLLSIPNVVLLPHIGSATAKTRFNMAMVAAENLVAALYGKQPPNVVDELKDLP